MNAVVVSFDALALAGLGCYGGELAQTPQLNWFAAGATVFDAHFAEDCSPTADPPWGGEPGLVQRLNDASVATTLVSDCAEGSPPWGRFVTCPTATLQGQAASLPHGNVFSRLVDSLIALIETATDLPSLFWLHARGPSLRLVEGADWASVRREYAVAVEEIDRAIGRVIDAVNARWPDDPPLIAITAARGCHLGEHTPSGADLLEANVHAPLIVRVPWGRLAACLLERPSSPPEPYTGRLAAYPTGERCRELVQPRDASAMVAEWFGIPWSVEAMLGAIRDRRPLGREAIFIRGAAGSRGVRTRDYYYVECAVDGSPAPFLFTKPQDRWDVDDLSRREPGVVEELAALLESHGQSSTGSMSPRGVGS